MPVNKVAHHSKHQRKTRPKARFYLLLAEWTGLVVSNKIPLYHRQIKGFRQVHVVKTCGEI
jgi:hypothetical protein